MLTVEYVQTAKQVSTIETAKEIAREIDSLYFSRDYLEQRKHLLNRTSCYCPHSDETKELLRDTCRLLRKADKFPLAKRKLRKQYRKCSKSEWDHKTFPLANNKLRAQLGSYAYCDITSPPSLQDIEDSLNCSDLEYLPQSKDFFWKVEDVELEDKDGRTWFLGSFTCFISTSCDGKRIRVIADDVEYESADGHTHPHVESEVLCMGEIQHKVKTLFRRGDFVQIMDLTAATLRTYNPDSPHCELESWEGVICDCCGRSNDPEDVICCEGCHDTICSAGQENCLDCGDYYCTDCLTTCDDCQEYICSHCSRDGLCENCAVFCEKCESHFALDEVIHRPCCDKFICKSCLGV